MISTYERMSELLPAETARNEKPRPSVTEPAAIGSEASSGSSGDPLLAAAAAMREPKNTARSYEMSAMQKLLTIPSAAVLMIPVLPLAMSCQASSVKVPPLVKNAL